MSEPSYVLGPDTPPLLNETIGRRFTRAASAWPDREALVVRHQSIRWTYKELANVSKIWRLACSQCGLSPGDRIGIWSPNNSEWVLTQFASAIGRPDSGHGKSCIPDR